MTPPIQHGEPVPQTLVDSVIRQATGDVFATMLSIDDVAAETLPQPQNRSEAKSGIFSLIGMAGAWAGTASLVCSADFACRISSRFLDTPFSEVNEEVLDAMAELTNMIGGNIKTMLEPALGEMSLSTPTVISGHTIQAHSARLNHWIIVRFTCGDGDLYVQTCLAPSQRSEHARPGLQLPMLLSPA